MGVLSMCCAALAIEVSRYLVSRYLKSSLLHFEVEDCLKSLYKNRLP